MKKKWMMLIAVFAVFTILFVTGCKEDPGDPSERAFRILIDYMDNNEMSITDLFDGWIIAPDSLIQVMDDHYLMDIRTSDKHGATVADPADSLADYYNGHIAGAVLSSLGDIVVDAAPADKPIVVVCYTGQAASHAVMALRLSGYPDAQVLKWGMSGWNGDFDLWTGNCAQLNHANWIAAPGDIAATEEFGCPGIDTDLLEGAAILEERVSVMLAGGFIGISAENDDNDGVLDDPSLYFINNFWDDEDVEDYGNIVGAYRIKPLILDNLDPDATVVTYCWTGQTSSMITAYLNLLGYDAKSLKFGVNGIIHDDLDSHKWSGSEDYPYE